MLVGGAEWRYAFVWEVVLEAAPELLVYSVCGAAHFQCRTASAGD